MYDRKDKYYQKAKKEGYPSRAAYKLLELHKKYSILKSNHRIIDLGCAPGGWLKVAEEKINSKTGTMIVGIDLLPLGYEPGNSVSFFQGDFLIPDNQQKIIGLIGEKADWIISDMSPNLTGIKFKDFAASTELAQSAFEFCKACLKKGGGLVTKIFPGPDTNEFIKALKKSFMRVDHFMPDSTRKTSDEVYIVAIQFK